MGAEAPAPARVETARRTTSPRAACGAGGHSRLRSSAQHSGSVAETERCRAAPPRARGPCQSPASRDWSCIRRSLPTGNFVAFAWEGEGGDNFDIYVQSIDGSFQGRLTTHAADDHAPAWSPDGQRIAFVRDLDGKREIVVLPALGGREQQLFEAVPEGAAWCIGAWSYGLSWTPDGKHLVFGDLTDSGPTSAIHLYLVRGW